MTNATNEQSTIDLAIERFMEECYLESNKILLELVGAGITSSFISFCIGRNFLYLKEHDQARSWFERSAGSEAPFPWTFYELMRLFAEVGDSQQSARCLASFLSSPDPQTLNDVHRQEILKVAHECFLYDRRRAADLYELISRYGVRDYLCELRIAERLIDQRKLEQADARLQALCAWRELDAWGLFALARIRFGQGVVDEAVATVLKAMDAQPGNAGLKVIGVHRLIDFHAFELANRLLVELIQPLAATNTVMVQEAANIEFRLAIVGRAHGRILEMCRIPEFLARAPEWLPVDALFALALPESESTPQGVEAGGEIARFLEDQDGMSLGRALALYQFYGRRRNWARIDLLEERIRSTPLFDDPGVVLRRFEALCGASRLREAEALYRRIYSGQALQQSESFAVMRFLAEVQLWEEAGRVLLEFFEKGYFLPEGDHFLLKLCRKTGLHAEIVKRINAVAGPEAATNYGRIRQLIIDDALVKGLPCDFGSATQAQLSAHNAILRKPVHRAAHKRRRAGILCCNRTYFFSHLTFLASYSMCNLDAETIDWYAVYDSDVPDRWHGIASRFAAKLSIELTILKEKKILDCAVERTEAYGMFTGGNTLSRSAFLRIYAARHLRDLGAYDRAVYIDSDIVCLRDISGLWSMPFENQLLMARPEEPSAEVRAASALNGLVPEHYFNSGVLAFNLQDTAIDAHLAHAIGLAEHDQARLMFHDQCALNIAFKDRVRHLPAEYNHFLRPHRQDNGDLAGARLIHFLDRPKPWDVSYQRSYRSHWERQAEIVRALLTASEYNAVTGAGNQ